MVHKPVVQIGGSGSESSTSSSQGDGYEEILDMVLARCDFNPLSRIKNEKQPFRKVTPGAFVSRIPVRDERQPNNNHYYYCHFENILAEMKHISAALTAGTPVFPQEGRSWGERR